MTREEQVKEIARGVGFDAVGVTTPEPPGHEEHVAAWLDAEMHAGMGYLRKRAALRAGRLDVPELVEGARAVVVVALSYHWDEALTPRGLVARYARGEDYHPLMWEKLNAFGAKLNDAFGPDVRWRGFADSGPLRERELAARAGLGWQGKHTNLISLDLGNWFFLGALLTTLELAPDEPFAGGHCGTCTRCLAACPTGAIVAPHTLDARRCISYLTIEERGAIARELRPLMGNRIFGCDDCLAACPWNDRAQAARELRLAALPGHERPDLLHWIALLADEDAFRAEFKNTPLLRPKRAGLRRNVCVALGNVGGVEAVAGLRDALSNDPSPLVRGHAAWALGRIARRTGSGEALDALRAAADSEADEEARAEIAAARAA